METRANYVMIGLLTLVAIIGAFGFVYWFQRAGGVGERAFYRVVFDSPAQGLRTGGAVLFNGIRVGEVTELRLRPQNPRQVVATISVDLYTPVRSDTRASLSFQGLTGIASISLRGGDPGSPLLAALPGEAPPIIPVDEEATQDVTETARSVLRKLEVVVTENQESLRSAIKNIDTFSAALARNAEQVDRIVAGLGQLTGSGDGKGEIPEAVQAFHRLADNLDKRTADITADVRRAVRQLETTIRNFDRNPQRILFGNPPAAQERR
ncbi:MAG TPA: MlaD family protein [Xanthobacteraceae bacterium]|nr:MlaD family protein [Xanthobacteraceae bacterium]